MGLTDAEKRELVRKQVSGLTSRQKAGEQKMGELQQKEAARLAAEQAVNQNMGQGVTILPKRVDLNESGSEAYHQSPDRVVVGEQRTYDEMKKRKVG